MTKFSLFEVGPDGLTNTGVYANASEAVAVAQQFEPPTEDHEGRYFLVMSLYNYRTVYNTCGLRELAEGMPEDVRYILSLLLEMGK